MVSGAERFSNPYLELIVMVDIMFKPLWISPRATDDEYYTECHKWFDNLDLYDFSLGSYTRQHLMAAPYKVMYTGLNKSTYEALLNEKYIDIKERTISEEELEEMRTFNRIKKDQK